MSYLRFTPAHIYIDDFSHLTAAWRAHRDFMVGSYTCEAALTPTQLRRLPKALKAILRHGRNDSD